VPASRYGEATGITQTVRNFGSSLGMAVLGTVLILQNRSNLEETAAANGVPKVIGKVVDGIPHDFALATQTVFYAMAGVMAVAFVVALATMPAGKVEQQVAEPGDS
jgi:hypothetical protein